MLNEQRCRSCGAPVYWLKNSRTGKTAPIDARLDATGNILINEELGEYGVINPKELPDERDAGTFALHTNHFVTCPQRTFWKREARQ